MSHKCLDAALALIAKDVQRSIAEATKYAEQVQALEDAGFATETNEWRIKHGSNITVKREHLPILRKIVGKLKVTGKYVPNDFNETSMLQVSIRPVSKDFDQLGFTYLSPYRGGGKCHIETTVSTYQSLVCKN